MCIQAVSRIFSRPLTVSQGQTKVNLAKAAGQGPHDVSKLLGALAAAQLLDVSCWAPAAPLPHPLQLLQALWLFSQLLTFSHISVSLR